MTQALLDANCSIVISKFGFFLLPDVGKRKDWHDVVKRQSFELVKRRVLFNHSPLTNAYLRLRQPIIASGGWRC